MKKPHIVYLHGFASSSKIFNHLKAQLPKHKITSIDYTSNLSVEDIFNQAKEQLPTEEVVLVCHSLGGIIGNLLCTRNAPSNIIKLVTISTPFGGSPTANLMRWFYPSLKILSDLSPTSKIIKEISGKQSKPDCDFLSIISTGGHMPYIASSNDGVITLESQRKSKAKSVLEIEANHFEIVQDPKTIDEIKRFIF